MTTQKDLEIRIADSQMGERVAHNLVRSLRSGYVKAYAEWQVGDEVSVRRTTGKMVKHCKVWQVTLSDDMEFTYYVDKAHGYLRNEVRLCKGDTIVLGVDP
jgi:hypothetical protein